jgi:hypothetical protein
MYQPLSDRILKLTKTKIGDNLNSKELVMKLKIAYKKHYNHSLEMLAIDGECLILIMEEPENERMFIHLVKRACLIIFGRLTP